MTCPMLAVDFDAATCGVLRKVFPEARYWNSKMGELHSTPDCEGVSSLHGPVYMYINKDRVPWEATGPCSLFGGVCQPSSKSSWRMGAKVHLVQVEAFAPSIPGLVFVDRDSLRGGMWLKYHSSAACQVGQVGGWTSTGCGRKAAMTLEEAVKRGIVSCAACCV
jgi:hypothetical protein